MIERIAILTRDRPASAGQVIDSAAALARGPRPVELVVVDDSRGPGASSEIAARVGDVRRGGVRAIHLGHAERRRLADAIIARGIDPRLVALALFDPFELDSTSGACRNLLQLWSADQRFLSVDDDMPLHAATPPGTGRASLELGEGDPTRFWFFDREPELSPAPEPDLLAWHDSMLGRTAHDAARTLGVPVRGPRSAGFARRAERELIVATWTGFAGDVATPNVLPYLKQRGEALRQLEGDGAFYRRAFAARQVIRAPATATVANGSFWSPGLAAYDPASLLPPFFPALRGQGQVFGALVRASFGVLGYLPIVVPHRPAPARRFDRAALERSAASFALSTLLVRWLHDHRRPAGGDPVAALRAAGDHLCDLAAGGVDTFAARIRAERRRYVDDVAAELERSLAESAHRFGPWGDDVRRYREVAREAAAAAPGSPTDVPEPERAQRLIRGFADLVCAWPEVVAAARSEAARRSACTGDRC